MAQPLWHVVAAAPLMALAYRRLGLVPALAAGAGAVALAAGWLSHLVLDTLVNRPSSPAGYLVLYRLRHRFLRVPGWLPSDAWRERYVTTRHPAPGEAGAAAALAALVLLLGSAGWRGRPVCPTAGERS